MDGLIDGWMEGMEWIDGRNGMDGWKKWNGWMGGRNGMDGWMD